MKNNKSKSSKMRKFKMFLVAMLAVASVAMVGCNSCSHNDDEAIASLNFDSIVRADYESMCSTVDSVADTTEGAMYFYEAQVWFDTVLSADTTHNVVKIMTVFQQKDTCYQIFHTLVNGAQVDSTVKINDYWLEDLPTTPYNVVNLDSAIVCAKNQARLPESKFVVMRRPLCPPFPTENYYIFGTMTNCITIDALDGHLVVDWGTSEAGFKSEK